MNYRKISTILALCLVLMLTVACSGTSENVDALYTYTDEQLGISDAQTDLSEVSDIEKMELLILQNMSYEILKDDDTSATYKVVAPDMNEIMSVYIEQEDEEIEMTVEEVEAEKLEIYKNINSTLESGEFETVTNTVKVTVTDGVPELSFELVDAFYGGLASLVYG